MKTVFLGGTCNNSTWRDQLIPLLKINYFNPVVANWTKECQEREILSRSTSDYVLYVITPKMTGFYSIAEVVDDSNKRPEKTFFCVLDTDLDNNGHPIYFLTHQMKSFNQIKKMVIENGGTVIDGSIESISDTLNNYEEYKLQNG